jgi:hypothetical protein
MVAVAIVGAAVVGGAATVASGNKAAKAQQYGTDQAVNEQRRVDELNRAENAPFRETGVNALDKLARMYGVARSGAAPGATNADGSPADYGGFETSPGYAFRRDEGLKAIDRANSSRGLLGSGAAKKAGGRFADGLASSEYENFTNRLAALAGVGQSATAQNAASSTNAANNIGNAYIQGGNARASAYANTGSAINSTVNSLANVYAYGKGGGFSVPKVNTNYKGG